MSDVPNSHVGGSRLYQLIYASNASREISDDDLRSILAKSRQNNARLAVGGILVYCSACFFQVLEGPAEHVGGLYDKIERDDRHRNIRIVARENLRERDFPEWSMGFATQAHDPTLVGLNDFLADNFSLNRFVERPTLARSLLISFRLGNWRRAVKTS